MNEFEIHVPKQLLRTSQIIAAALPLGALTFLGVVLAMRLPNGMPVNILDIMEFVLFAQAGVCLVLAYVIPETVMKSTAQQQFKGVNLDEHVTQESRNPDGQTIYLNKLMGIYQTSMIIGCALLEGAVFFGIVIYMQSDSMWGLIVAGLFIPLMLFKIPTESSVQSSFAKLIAQNQFERGASS